MTGDDALNTADVRWNANNAVAVAEGLHRQLERLAATLAGASPGMRDAASLAVMDAAGLVTRVRGLRRRVLEVTGDTDLPPAA